MIELTEEALQVVWTAVVRPVCVLQVPHGPLLTRQEMLDLQPRGGVAARLRAEARGDLEAAVRDRVVAGAQPRPVAEALLPASLLEKGGGGVDTSATGTSRTNPPHPLGGV